MGIQVECPHGHTFKVKDKYAGKKGLCPKCEGQVVVHVPDATTSKATESAYREAVMQEHRAANPVDTGSSVFDDDAATPSSSTSGSLLGSSVIRHNVKCPKCGNSVPMWFAKCQNCGQFMQH